MAECRANSCTNAPASKGWCKVHAERVRRNGHPNLIGRPRKSPAERLWVKIDRSGGPTACWPFTGRLDTQGYGSFRMGAKGSATTGSHRAAWLLTYPDQEPPELLDHMCHDPRSCHLSEKCPHRRCCNPAHLNPSTPAENAAPHRRWGFKPTHCARGHEFDEANTYYRSDGGRNCRACDLARYHEAKARKRSAA